MPYSHDFFESNIPNWKKLLKQYKSKRNLTFLEIGCLEGRTTKWLLDNILTHPTSKITVIDTFKGSMEDKKLHLQTTKLLQNFEINLITYLNRKPSKVKIMQGYSYKILRSISPTQQFDFIYIDGSHRAKDVLEDAILSWRLLKVNGLLIFDDYLWDVFSNPILCPFPAINSFLTFFEGNYKLIYKGYQLAVIKLGEDLVPKKKKKGIGINNTLADYKKYHKKETHTLKKDIKFLMMKLDTIQNSKTYRIWQIYSHFKKKVFGKP